MLIVRWSFTPRMGRADDCVSILRKWEVDVGQRIGFKGSSLRLMQGVIGTPESQVQLETRFETMSEVENAWSDMDAAPYHKEYMRQLEPLVTPGSNGWSAHREIDIIAR